MATIVTFDPSRQKRAAVSGSSPRSPAGSAKVLIFTGVWRERLSASNPAAYKPRKPMFEEPAPAKSGTKKPRRRKNG